MRHEPLFVAKGTGGFADGIQAPVVHLIEGGAYGYAKQWRTWLNNARYVSKPPITLLLEAPKGFRLLPDGETNIAVLRSLVEDIRHRVSGLTAKLEVSVDDSQSFGGSGQKLETPTNVREAQSTVSMSFHERMGLPVYRYFRYWITTLIMDAETKYAAIGTYQGTEAYDALPDMYAMSMLFIEPDMTGRTVVQSWLGVNMFPKTTGDNELEFDKDSDGKTREVQIDFTGMYQYGPGVDYMAQKFLDAISLIGANEYHRAALDGDAGIDAIVAGARVSYADTVRNISKRQYR